MLFESAAVGGIPIIRPQSQCLARNEISEVMGIIHGTTNFVLTKMGKAGIDFAEVLQLATGLGYVGPAPTEPKRD